MVRQPGKGDIHSKFWLVISVKTGPPTEPAVVVAEDEPSKHFLDETRTSTRSDWFVDLPSGY